MKVLYDKVCLDCSMNTTKSYSTSFSLGIRFLAKHLQQPIYALYGFVRFADEIVDTFHNYDKKALFERFKEDTYFAIDQRISLNPILHSFQETYHKYGIKKEHVDTFLRSMEMDLYLKEYDQEGYEEYILGSAEVVGLMCLRIFSNGDDALCQQLYPYARKLGAAFQKINFLRDLHEDYENLGRAYFPGLTMEQFDEQAKKQIEAEIEADFTEAYKGIVQLPKDSRFGVYVAYVYYFRLFTKIRKLPSHRILQERIRIPNRRKFTLFLGSYVRHSFNMI